MEPDRFLHSIDQPYKPFYFLEPLIGAESLESYFRNMVDKAPNLTTIGEHGHPAAMGSWSDSPWDTHNIHYKTARIHFLLGQGEEHSQDYQKLYRDIEADLISQGYEYLLFRINTSDLPSFRTAQNHRFEVVDGLLTLAWEGKPQTDVNINVRVAREEDLSAVKDIARTSFIFDRFHTDPAIPNEVADKLHANWIYDSFANNPDERVLVAEEDHQIIGFLSYSINEGLSRDLGIKIMTLILLATHSGARNKGAAKSLILQSLKNAHQESFNIVLVGTQLRNVKATRLYEKLGFKIVDSSYTLRKLLKSDPS